MGIPEDQNLAGYSCLTEPYSFIYRRHTVVTDPGILKNTGYKNIPMSVGIGLYRGHESASGARKSLQFLHIIQKIFFIYTDPCPVCLMHFRFSPFVF